MPSVYIDSTLIQNLQFYYSHLFLYYPFVKEEEEERYVFVYWLGRVCPNRELFSIFKAKIILERGNPAMLTNPSLIDYVPWPNPEHSHIPSIKGRILETGGNLNRPFIRNKQQLMYKYILHLYQCRIYLYISSINILAIFIFNISSAPSISVSSTRLFIIK